MEKNMKTYKELQEDIQVIMEQKKLLAVPHEVPIVILDSIISNKMRMLED